MKNKDKSIGIIFVTLAAICWGQIGWFIRTLNSSGFSSMQMVALRSLGATLLLAVYFLILDRDAFKIKFKDIWVFVGTGLGSMVFFNFCYFASINHTSLAIAAALLYTAPAFVGILARIFLRERLSKFGIVGIVLAILGCMMTSGFFTQFGNIDVIGLLLGLGSGFGYALYSIFGKIAISKGYKSSTSTFYTFLVATVCTFFTLIKGNTVEGWNMETLFSVKLILALAGLVIISTVLAYIFYTKGLEKVNAGTASVFASIEPVVATIMGAILFGESLTWNVAVGLVCILMSTILAIR